TPAAGEAGDAAGGHQADVGQQDRDRPLAGRGNVAGRPDRIEFVLEAAHALEVVDVLAALEEQAPDPRHDRRQGAALETGERRHAELESLVALPAAPGDQLD